MTAALLPSFVTAAKVDRHGASRLYRLAGIGLVLVTIHLGIEPRAVPNFIQFYDYRSRFYILTHYTPTLLILSNSFREGSRLTSLRYAVFTCGFMPSLNILYPEEL